MKEGETRSGLSGRRRQQHAAVSVGGKGAGRKEWVEEGGREPGPGLQTEAAAANMAVQAALRSPACPEAFTPGWAGRSGHRRVGNEGGSCYTDHFYIGGGTPGCSLYTSPGRLRSSYTGDLPP